MSARCFGLFLLLLAACSSGPVRLDEAHIREHGTRRFEASPAEVWLAFHAALVADGWAPLPSRPDAGPVRTPPRDVGGGVVRAWEVEVAPEGDGTRAVARPRAYVDGRDVSEEAVWTPTDEARRWDALFASALAILAAWGDPPEFVERGDAIVLEAHRFVRPAGWAATTIAPNGRAASMQRGTPGPDGALNPTILLAVAPTRPETDRAGFGAAAVRAAFRHLGGVEPPAGLRDMTTGPHGVLGRGEVTLSSGKVVAVRVHVWDARSPAWTLVASAACGADDDDCERSFAALVEGVDAPTRRRSAGPRRRRRPRRPRRPGRRRRRGGRARSSRRRRGP